VAVPRSNATSNRDEFYFQLGGFLNGFIRLSFEQSFDVELIKQTINDALHYKGDHERAGATAALAAIIDLRFSIIPIEIPQLDAELEAELGNRQLIRRHFEQAAERWYELRATSLSDEAIRDFLDRATLIHDPEPPQRTAQ
jgi:hypothetical protein